MINEKFGKYCYANKKRKNREDIFKTMNFVTAILGKKKGIPQVAIGICSGLMIAIGLMEIASYCIILAVLLSIMYEEVDSWTEYDYGGAVMSILQGILFIIVGVQGCMIACGTLTKDRIVNFVCSCYIALCTCSIMFYFALIPTIRDILHLA